MVKKLEVLGTGITVISVDVRDYISLTRYVKRTKKILGDFFHLPMGI